MAESWVGGDIGGLAHMGAAYTGAKKELEGPLKPIGRCVDALVKDAGWQGDAADQFNAAWSVDAMTAGAFATLVSETGDTLTTLSGHLKAAEHALQNAEDVAVRAGVPMKAKGVPDDLPADAESKAKSALSTYVTVRKEVLHTAQQARLDAAERLNKLFDDVTVAPGDMITVADYLRGLYAVDSEARRGKGKDAATKLDAAKQAEIEAKKEWRRERKAFEAEGKKLPKDFPAKGAYRDAIAQVEDLKTRIAAAEHGSSRVPYDRELNVKVADAAKVLRAGEGIEKLPEFLREMPVVDVAAAGACGILEAKGDHDEGWSWKHSLIVDGTANFGGLAAGTAVTALGVVGAGAAGFTAPVWAVAGVGGAAVVLSTEFIDNAIHEHWSEDIHDFGVVGGVLHGTGHVASETVDDAGKLVTGAAKGVWHGIKSIF
ncbi:hypothetical protein AB0I49_36325 [Streptomyces sp. NPDC050617]|uniref:hypothetical protein n=1 Tax=Streptomyces sp. NPDC050617 TaxID=3154628 RepID=UPI00343D91BB